MASAQGADPLDLAFLQFVHDDGEDDHASHDHHLAGVLETEEVHAVADDDDDGAADEGAEDAPLASHEGGAADNNRGDDVEFEGHAPDGFSGIELRRHY